MKSDRHQTMVLAGIGLLVIAAIMVYFALSQPKVYETESAETSVSEMQQAEENTTETVEFPLNINTATVEELMLIDGLGEERAYAIVEYREYLGSYDSVEQIKNIQGIGDVLYEQVQPYLTV